MRRSTRRKAVLVLAVGGLVALGGAVAGPDAGAAITDPVSYQVGPLAVFGTSMRNSSCSLSRNYLNTGATSVRVLSSVVWDGQLGHVRPQPGTSALDGDDVLEPGEQATIVWTNDGHISPTAEGMLVLISVVQEPELAGDFGFNHMEPVEPCLAAPVETVPTTLPVPPPVAPPVTEVPGPVGDPPPAGPAPSAPAPTISTTGTGVLSSSTGPMVRPELPATGAGDWLGVAALVAAAAVVTGATIEVATRTGRRS